MADFYEISATDPDTIVMRSRTARILALEELANVALSTGSADGGIGPFVVDALTPDRLQLHAFRAYFNGVPALDVVEFRSFRSQRSAWAAMMRNEIDALYEINREAVEFVELESRVRVYSFMRPYVAGLVFNVSRPPLKSRAVRRAVAAAIDRTEIMETAFRGRAEPAYGPLWPEYWALPADAPKAVHDPSLARELLNGLPAFASTSPTGSRVRFRCLVPTFETQPLERTALILQKQLYEFGIDMELESVSVRDLVDRLPSGKFDAVLMEFLGFTPSWLQYFWHSREPDSAMFNTGYTAADSALDALDLAKDEEELKRALRAVYARLVEDPPAVFLAWPEVSRAVNRKYEVPVEPGRDIMGANLRLWRPARAPRDTP